MDDREFEDYLVLEEIINLVYSGKPDGHTCPYCGKAELSCRVDEFTLRIECPACGKYFEGTLA